MLPRRKKYIEIRGSIYQKKNISTFRNHAAQVRPFSFKQFEDELKKNVNWTVKILYGITRSFGMSKKLKKLYRCYVKILRSTKPYDAESPEQIAFEQSICALVSKSNKPYSLVEHLHFRSLNHHLDPKIQDISRTRLTRTLLPKMEREIRGIVQNEVNTVLAVCLVYDL